VCCPSDEHQIAFREQQRLVARLSRCGEASFINRSGLSFHSDATYLITGGMGGLGRLLAGWMVGKGARHILLVGRRPPNSDVAAQIRELEIAGASISVVVADVSDSAQVAQLLTQIDPGLPLRGVFHCAAVLDDGIVLNQTWDRFERVLRPKLEGAWNLHTQTHSVALDHFVLFSSAASLLGNPGQANYAMANAFLDSLARFRRAQGLPGLSINWGIWSDSGGVAEKQLETVISAGGVGTINPATGLAALGRLLGSSLCQVAVMPIEWVEFIKRVGQWHYVDDFRETASAEPATRITSFIAALMKAPARERRTLLLDHVRQQVDGVLGGITAAGDRTRQGFFEMGMDSLTAVELKNRLQTTLGCTLPSTVAFECPTIEALVDFLSREKLTTLFETPSSDFASAAPATEHPTVETAIEGLSEQELNRRLDERLKTIEAALGR
jgi:acyl carrier protein